MKIWKPIASLILISFGLFLVGNQAWCTPPFVPLYHFASGDGANPGANLIVGLDGNLYGTTQYGGANNTGAVVAYGLAGSSSGVESTLYSFSALNSSQANVDGANPSASLVVKNATTFYGTTANGGANGTGTIFSITKAGVLTTVYSFSALGGGSTATNKDGANPQSGLVLASDGNFYGTTTSGGTNGNGTIFQLTPTGKVNIIYTFTALNSSTANTDGATPNGLIVYKKMLYGTTQAGGANNQGTIFQVTTAGKFTPLYSFGTGTNDGFGSTSPLVAGADGNFYGTTPLGGSANVGTIFQITPTGNFTTLYSFGSSITDGSGPMTGLILGIDNNLYGSTKAGGINNNGILFQVTTKGVLTQLYAFSAGDRNSVNNDGIAPNGLIQSSAGNMYGTTANGGASGSGVLFQLTLAPILTAVYPASGKVGATINLYGNNFTNIVTLKLGTTLTSKFTVVSSSHIALTVPQGATSGPISVQTLNGTVASGLPFTVTH